MNKTKYATLVGLCLSLIVAVTANRAQASATSGDAVLPFSPPQAGDVDLSFHPGSRIDDRVDAIVVQPDGKILIGGLFTSVLDVARGHVARLNADGSTDHSFGDGLAGADGDVSALAVQPDGKVLIGGDFSLVNGESRVRIARLNNDGTLDTGFLDGLAGANGVVSAIAVQPDGKVLLGGAFTTVNGETRNRIARLNADGSLDSEFLNGLAGASSSVAALAVQPDGKVLIAGNFGSVNGVTRGRIARLNSDGTLDTSFLNGLTGASGNLYTMVLQPDGKVLIGGLFTSVNGTSRGNLARLNADGSIDTGFLNGLAGADHQVFAIALLPDGKALIAGTFGSVNGVARNRIARLNADGAVDSTFGNVPSQLELFQGILDLAVQSDGKVLLGVVFTVSDGIVRPWFIRLNADGSLDNDFPNGPPGPNGYIDAIALQPDGKVLIAGSFRAVNGRSQDHVARLNPDGTIDLTFASVVNGDSTSVNAIALQPDGKILVAGSISGRIVRLNADGTRDTTFNAGVSQSIYAIALQPDGKVLIGGIFTSPRNYIARLNTNGSLDTTFNSANTASNNRVHALALQPDGKVLIGGFFSGVVRLNGNGTLDTTFSSSTDGWIECLARQPDGKVLIGGAFNAANGVSRSNLARLNGNGSLDTGFLNGLPGPNGRVHGVAVQSDGKVLIGGPFTTVHGVSRNEFARLNADGSLDTTFLSGVAGANGEPTAFAEQPDGKLLVGGGFSAINQVSRSFVARVYAIAQVPPAITLAPQPQFTYEGCCATFTVSATGTPPLEYQWRKDGFDLEDGPHVSGSNTDTLTLTGVDATDQGTYDVVVSNDGGSATSPGALFRVFPVQCKAASCDAMGVCVFTNLSDGVPCEDGDACTDDVCMSGTCIAGVPLICDDGAHCNGFEGCISGSECAPGFPVECDDGVACTVDSCDEASDSCSFAPNNAACDDGLYCNGVESCTATGCAAGSPVVCDDGVACTLDSCDEASDSCSFVANSALCDDGVYCNGVETCTETGCQAGVPVVCDDGVNCTVDSCVEATDSCAFAPNNLACDDGNPCTDDICTTTACAYLNNTAPCDDGSDCTSGDVCQSGVCVGDTTRPMPKTKGHYKKLCKRNELTADEAVCVALTAPLTFGNVDTVEEVCDETNGHDSDLPGHDSDERHCTKDETELLVLSLNICTGRICPSQPIDSEHSDNNTVQESLDEADQHFGDPARDKDSCHYGKDLAKEINNGKALRMDTLQLDKLANGIRLTWAPPFIGDDQAIVKYEVWRSPRGGDAFTKLHTGTSTTYVDSVAGDFDYEVLVEIQE